MNILHMAKATGWFFFSMIPAPQPYHTELPLPEITIEAPSSENENKTWNIITVPAGRQCGLGSVNHENVRIILEKNAQLYVQNIRSGTVDIRAQNGGRLFFGAGSINTLAGLLENRSFIDACKVDTTNANFSSLTASSCALVNVQSKMKVSFADLTSAVYYAPGKAVEANFVDFFGTIDRLTPLAFIRARIFYGPNTATLWWKKWGAGVDKVRSFSLAESLQNESSAKKKYWEGCNEEEGEEELPENKEEENRDSEHSGSEKEDDEEESSILDKLEEEVESMKGNRSIVMNNIEARGGNKRIVSISENNNVYASGNNNVYAGGDLTINSKTSSSNGSTLFSRLWNSLPRITLFDSWVTINSSVNVSNHSSVSMGGWTMNSSSGEGSSSSGEGIVGSGKSAMIDRSLSCAYSHISINGSLKAKLYYSMAEKDGANDLKKPEIRITGDDNLVEFVTNEIVGNELCLSFPYSHAAKVPLEVVLFVNSLNGVTAHGASTVTFDTESWKKGGSMIVGNGLGAFTVSASGSSTVALPLLIAKSLVAKASGSSTINMEGTVANSTITTAGTSKVTILNLIGENCVLSCSDLSTVDAKELNIKTIKPTLVGFSKITLNGAVTDLIANLSDMSNLHSASLQASKVKVNGQGTSLAKVWPTKNLDVTLSGVSNVHYRGSPKVTQLLSGVSDLRRLNS